MANFPLSTLKDRIDLRLVHLRRELAACADVPDAREYIHHLQANIGSLEWVQREIKDLEEDASRATFAVNPEANCD